MPTLLKVGQMSVGQTSVGQTSVAEKSRHRNKVSGIFGVFYLPNMFCEEHKNIDNRD